LSPCFSPCWLIRTKESVEENSSEKQQKRTIVFSEDVFFFWWVSWNTILKICFTVNILSSISLNIDKVFGWCFLVGGLFIQWLLQSSLQQ
jgi:hypothetical protein